ncbi:hypothetical protein OAory_01091760 [Aspergillus oryzae]|uniref:Uncharacterized protein n=1 Tax=Aspergillus oryzae TaxID=5062 RepID=A0A1S9DD08_ASPOZ|nr:hypothetical protein OAory_01091760 [Aspergillus oryzae]
MSGTDPIDPNARREVSKAIASSGSAAVGRMIDAANSSVEKRRRNKEARAKREVEKKAAKEGQPPYLAFSDVMDTDVLVDLVHEVQGQLWVEKVNETYRMDCICQWVLTFHLDKLPCQFDSTFYHGAFNAGYKEREFSSLTKWFFSFMLLRRHFGAEWAMREKEFDHTEKLEAFAARKVDELDKYDKASEKMEEKKALVDSENITKQEFIANALIEAGSISHFS